MRIFVTRSSAQTTQTLLPLPPSSIWTRENSLSFPRRNYRSVGSIYVVHSDGTLKLFNYTSQTFYRYTKFNNNIMTWNENITPISLASAATSRAEAIRICPKLWSWMFAQERNGLITHRLPYYLSVFSGVLSVCDPYSQRLDHCYCLLHVCPSTRPYGTTWLPLDGFSLILVFE
jgi:hypothetical protein